MNLYIGLLLALGVFIILTILYLRSSIFGRVPDRELIEKIKSSPAYNIEKQRFQNRLPHLHGQMNKRNFKLKTFIETMREWFGNQNGYPDRKLPSIKPDIEKFLSDNTDSVRFIWLGHSTILLNISDIIILIDPVFARSASPFSFLAKRFQRSPLTLDELPDVDIVLISHDHFDHLDQESVEYFRDYDCHFICPLGVSSHLMHWGITQDRISEAGWWDTIEYENLEFIAAPAQHFSGRDLFHSNKTLWASWVVQSPSKKVFYSGDSGYDSHFKEIGKKLGPFDLSFIETGQYNPKWQEVHMLPRESAQAFIDVKGGRYVPIHWGMFELSLHSWDEPIVEISRISKELTIPLISPKLGEIVDLYNPVESLAWWKYS